MTFNPVEHLDGYGLSLGICGPYEPSIASSASSSQVSVFSDTLSAQSSIASSISDDFRCARTEDARERDTLCAQAQLQYQTQIAGVQGEKRSVLDNILKPNVPCPTYAAVTSVPAPQRQHPRRCSNSKAQKPPPLVRQRDRKINFVDNLVDSATQMVEVIWPLSSIFCQSEGGERGVLPMRKYIEETLKRSRTSYSTLQVALYYLILIRPHVPRTDFTMEQSIDCPAARVLMCGRRMFLAALILASKYLQDRNYSAKAWSKMSGLSVCEINQNERSFLAKIDWNLHLPKPLFEKWQDIVLRYTPNPPTVFCAGVESGSSTWKRIVPLLTPQLDNMPTIENKINSAIKLSPCSGFASLMPAMPATPAPHSSMFSLAPMESTSNENTPTPSTILPRFLEPTPELGPPTPALVRMGPLPTPNMTPSSIASNTPAVSVLGGRMPAMSSAMVYADQMNSSRCSMDFQPMHPAIDSRYPLSRRPSMMSVTSYGSSPESMVSDRSSRSSSISSVSTTSSMAPQRACLARQATCRNARLPPLKLLREEMNVGTSLKPIIVDDDMDLVESPEINDFSISDKVLHTPHRHSRSAKHAPAATSVPHHHTEKSSKKRGRPISHGHRRSELQEEVRYLLEESLDDESMDLDEVNVSPSYAAEYASDLLVRSRNTRQARDARVAFEKNEGKKRTCCSAEAMSVSPVSMYGEIV
ncbi:uncharacterized protein RCC_12059 [Ramularia collo-cygni]|uniref:G1/S-specific cyclin pas1 n=1 Tax=Ramularia collo-cygni TaxID=112498 RepID=A0A2D3UUD5_9PEZI|nr:uncharacterized protein RCC_12059 [Ramularia collo-cygni]CZT15577.1 uncharacterized protein RCC_12059 [Ramularia collo-cygni]